MKNPKWLLHVACALALTPLACTDDSHVPRNRVSPESGQFPGDTSPPSPPGTANSPNSGESSNPKSSVNNPQDPSSPREGTSSRGRTSSVSGGGIADSDDKKQSGTINEKLTMPLSSYILQVRMKQVTGKLESLSAHFSTEMRSPDETRLQQFKAEKMPQSPTDIVYFFLRPGDRIELSYRIAPGSMPVQSGGVPNVSAPISLYDFQALGVDSCERLSQQEPTTIINQMQQSIADKAAFLQLTACLGNTTFIEKWRNRIHGPAAKDFVQDWYDFSVSAAEKGAMDLLSRSINGISLYRFLISYSKNVIIPGNINGTASRELDSSYQKSIRNVPSEYRKLAGLIFVAEALHVRVMDDILNYLKDAQTKRIRYKGLTDSSQHREWLSQRIQEYKNRTTELLQVMRQTNQGNSNDDIINEMISTLKTSPVPDNGNKSILQTDLQSMGKSYLSFQKEFERIQSLLSNKNNDVIDVKFLRSQWETFFKSSIRFAEKASNLMDSGKSLSNKENMDQFNSFRNALLPEIKSQLQAYLSELNNPFLMESVFKRGLGTKPFLDLEIQTSKEPPEKEDALESDAL